MASSMAPDDRALLLLGMLKAQRSHGYQVHEFIEKNLARVADMKKATAYATLDKLAHEGLIDVTAEQVGNRPTRKVYALNRAGEARFLELLRARLSAAGDVRNGSDVAVMFLDDLVPDEARAALAERLRETRKRLAAYEAAPAHGMGAGVDLALDHVRFQMRAEVAWLEHAVVTLTPSKKRRRHG